LYAASLPLPVEVSAPVWVRVQD